MSAKTVYFVAYISTHAGRDHPAPCWSRGYDTESEAADQRDREIAEGNASFACIVEFVNGEKIPQLGSVRPQAAGRAVLNWEAILEATED